jgi:hypothetical protein
MNLLTNIAICGGSLVLGWYATEGVRVLIARGKGKAHHVRHLWDA